MFDVLGREVKENDLVLGMVISRDSDGIRFGVSDGKSVTWSTRNCGCTFKSVMSNIYLIENPSEKELEIKQQIVCLIEKSKQEQLEKNSKEKR